MDKKLVLQIDKKYIQIFLFKNKKLISKEEHHTDNLIDLKDLLINLYNMKFKKILVILKDDFSHYEIFDIPSTKNDEIKNTSKLYMFKHISSAQNNYYTDIRILKKYKHNSKVLINICMKNLIDEIITFLTDLNFHILSITPVSFLLYDNMHLNLPSYYTLIQRNSGILIINTLDNVVQEIMSVSNFDMNHIKFEINKIKKNDIPIYYINDVNEYFKIAFEKEDLKINKIKVKEIDYIKYIL